MAESRAGQAFITMLAGYQVYKSKSKSSPIEIARERTAQARSVNEIPAYYLNKGSVVKNLYVGNRIFYKYVPSSALDDKVSDSVHRQVRGVFRSAGYKGDNILQNFFPNLVSKLKEDGNKIPIGSAAISTPSERMTAIGMPAGEERTRQDAADPVDVIHEGSLSQGAHSMTWNGHNVSSGVYFVQAISGDMMLTQKLMLVK